MDSDSSKRTGSAQTVFSADKLQEIGHSSGNFQGQAVAWLVLLCSLLLSFAAWHITGTESRTRIQEQFNFRSRRIESDIRERLLAYEHMLRGGVSLFLASEEVTRDEWRLYVDTLNVNQHYPGIQGFGFSKYIPAAEKDAHTAGIRAQGFPDYAIYPAGDRPEYTSIVYLEPFNERNRLAFGYDMFSEPVRRAAMIRARDTGRVAMSGKVTLVQENGTDVQSGFLVYLPLYRKGPAPVTVEQRRAALVGYVYSPFRMKDFMAGLLEEDHEYVEIEVFDGLQQKDEALLYKDDSIAPEQTRTPLFSSRTAFEFGEHEWLLVFYSSRYFEEHVDLKKANLILALGIMISLLLSNMIFVLSKSRRQTAVLAEMASGLKAANMRLKEEITSRERAEAKLDERAQELDDFNAAMVGREGRVIELKEEVNRLCSLLGRSPAYPPVWVNSPAEDDDRTKGEST